MPVSKKPRNKAKATRGAAAPPPVPTRRIREAYAAETAEHDRAAALLEADALIARALETGMTRLYVPAAHRALALSPLCIEAYTVLADEATDFEGALDLYKRAMHAGTLALGAETFKRDAGRFWDGAATQAYLRALWGLADTLLAMEREEDAIEPMVTMLRLDHGDALGARYRLLSYYLDQFDLQPARDLAVRFAEEQTATWLYSRVLLAYRDEQQDAAATRALVTAALTANPHVPGILARTHPDYFANEDEAIPPGSTA